MLATALKDMSCKLMDLSRNGRGRARGERVRDLWMVDVDHSSHRWRAKKKRNVFPFILD